MRHINVNRQASPCLKVYPKRNSFADENSPRLEQMSVDAAVPISPNKLNQTLSDKMAARALNQRTTNVFDSNSQYLKPPEKSKMLNLDSKPSFLAEAKTKKGSTVYDGQQQILATSSNFNKKSLSGIQK